MNRQMLSFLLVFGALHLYAANNSSSQKIQFKGQVNDSNGHSVENANIFALLLPPQKGSHAISIANLQPKPDLTGMLVGKTDRTGAFSVSLPANPPRPPGSSSSNTPSNGPKLFVFFVIDSSGAVGAGHVTINETATSATVPTIEIQ